MRPTALIAAALAALFAVSCAQMRDRDRVASRPSSTAQASDVSAQTRAPSETPLAAGGAGGNGGSTRN
jgi:hypothetical protein